MNASSKGASRNVASTKNKTKSCPPALFLVLACTAVFVAHQQRAGLSDLVNKLPTTIIHQAAAAAATQGGRPPETQRKLGLPDCTEPELSRTNQQLPNAKSTYFATKCPDAAWLQDHYIATADAKKKELSNNASATGIYLGCNKGMDAIAALRMLSYTKEFDTTRWKQALDPVGKMGSGACGQVSDMASYGLLYTNKTQARLKELKGRHEECLQEESAAPKTQAQVYCVEAMPDMAQLLASTAKTLNWDSSFHVTHAAMSDTDGKAFFPKASSQMGVEYIGLSDCSNGSLNRTAFCQEVPQWSLDTFVDNEGIHGDIDILSIDVEGYDYEVLMGSKRTLKRVKYLEFEINKGGRWPDHSLEVAIEMLSENGFACYWAGAAGYLWRITGCFAPLFETKQWSNVACVQLDTNAVLATRMEKKFQETLAADITYGDTTKDGTDGILSCGLPCRREYRQQKHLLENKKR